MWTEILVGGVVGGVAGLAGALAAEGVHLALRGRRNAALTAAGELPYKDEVFRPKWKLLVPAGVIASAVATGLGASLVVAVVAALALPVLLAAAGLYFFRPAS